MNIYKKFLSPFVLISALALSSTAFAADKGYQSVYSPLTGKHCITVGTMTLEAEQECAGMAGFRVRLIDADDRQSLTLMKGSKEYPLDFWSTVSSNFSELGKLIEWRVNIDKKSRDLQAIALIVRFKNSEGDGSKMNSDLVVVDLQRKNICAVGVVKATKDGKQNENARKMADNATGLKCLGN